jgi:hypothetical protein
VGDAPVRPALDPADAASERSLLAGHLRRQAQVCTRLGSPFYGSLMEATAADVEDGGPALDVLAGYGSRPESFMLALRLFGGVHRLVLSRRAPRLALHVDTVGGDGDAAAAWPALRLLLAEHGDDLRSALARPPQTNEVGRAAALLGGLLHVVQRCPLPVALHEVGASAGLNLRADAFTVTDEAGRRWGDPRSPVRLDGGWHGRMPPVDAPLRVVRRAGCDADPVDPATADGRLTLSSFVWPGQRERWERLRAALTVAARLAATVDRADAVDWTTRLRPQPGMVTVVWFSVVRQYLAGGHRAAFDAALERLLSAATPDAPVAVLSMERDPDRERDTLDGPPELPVVLRLADGRSPASARLLALAAPHGTPTRWL